MPSFIGWYDCLSLVIIDLLLWNKFQWNLNQIAAIFMQENTNVKLSDAIWWLLCPDLDVWSHTLVQRTSHVNSSSMSLYSYENLRSILACNFNVFINDFKTQHEAMKWNRWVSWILICCVNIFINFSIAVFLNKTVYTYGNIVHWKNLYRRLIDANYRIFH